MKLVKTITMALAFSFASANIHAAADTTGRKFVAETPDAILCIFNNPQKTRVIYYKTSGVKDDLVRYDGPNGYLLHYDLPSGQLLTNSTPEPAIADCVYNAMTLQELIEGERAYKTLVPMPSKQMLN